MARPKPKIKYVRKSIPVPEDADQAAKVLSELWDVTETDVHKLMNARGWIIETALREGVKIMFDVPGKGLLPYPEDRPISQLPVHREDLLKLLGSSNGQDGRDEGGT